MWKLRRGRNAMSSNNAEGRLATIEYLHTMLDQLKGMAEAQRHEVLAYLIDMASAEAGDILRSERMRQGQGGRRARSARST